MKILKSVGLSVLIAMPLTGFADGAETNVFWKSSAALGATYKSGNTDKSLYTMTLKGDRFSPENDWINSLYSEYGKTEGDQTEGQVRAQSDYRHKFGGENFFAGAFGEVLHDTIKQIRVRIKGGPDMGYYFINKESTKLDASLGVNGVYERTANGDDTYGEARAAVNYLWNITKKSSYYFNIEYNVSLENADKSNGLLVTGLKSAVKESLAMYVEMRDEYDNLPDAADIERNDVTIIAGLAYDF